MDRWKVAYESVEIHLPRAVNARHTLRGRWRVDDGFGADYVVGEKLDGVWVCWTGARLISKSGRTVAAPNFTRWLPPFPVVGELYCGTNTLSMATALVEHPNGPQARHYWAHARLVAFDIPGCPSDWPYRTRYALLRHVVAAWAHRMIQAELGGVPPHLLPLQLLRQFPATPDRVRQLFCAVVHGHSWGARAAARHWAFGVPASQEVVLAGTTTRARLALNDDDSAGWLAPQVNPFQQVALAARASGEGCMLWRQDGLWEARGRNSRGTEAIVKYKPVMIIAPRVVEPPWHSHRTAFRIRERDAVAGIARRLPGYHLRVQWTTPFPPRETQVFVAWVPPAEHQGSVVRTFPVDRRTFVAFVAYNGARPQYARALGATLNDADARCVQEHTWRCLQDAERRRPATAPPLNPDSVILQPPGEEDESSSPAAAVRVKTMYMPPPLDRLATAGVWESTEMRALFPCDFAWYPVWVCERASVTRLLSSHPALVPAGAASEPRVMAPRRRPRDAKEISDWQLRVAARWTALKDGPDRGLARTILGMYFACEAWRRAGRSPVPFTGVGMGLVQRWGPFQVADRESLPVNAYVERWLLLCGAAWLTCAASAWLALSPGLPSEALANALWEDPIVIDRLHARIVDHCMGLAAPLWSQPVIQKALFPPHEYVGFWPMGGNRKLDARAMARHTEGAAWPGNARHLLPQPRDPFYGPWSRFVFDGPWDTRARRKRQRRTGEADDANVDADAARITKPIVLTAQGIEATWGEVDHAVYNKVKWFMVPDSKHNFRVRWSPTVDQLEWDPRTCLPPRVVAAPPQLVDDDGPSSTGLNRALQLAGEIIVREAVPRRSRNNNNL